MSNNKKRILQIGAGSMGPDAFEACPNVPMWSWPFLTREKIDARGPVNLLPFLRLLILIRSWTHSYYASSVASATLAAAEKSTIVDQWVRPNPGVQPPYVPSKAGQL